MYLCKDGTQQMVIVDNFIPTIDNKLIFSRAHGKETWVIILEKAWAKIKGSYAHTDGGFF